MSRLNPGEPLPLAYVHRIERIPGVSEVDASVNFEAYYQRPEQSFGGVTRFESSLRSTEQGFVIAFGQSHPRIRVLLGGLLPAIRAARMPVASALKVE